MVLVLLDGSKIEVFGVSILVFLLLGSMVTLLGIYRKRMGRPAGVLRFSQEGYRIGAGSRVGILRPWRSNIRLEADYRDGTRVRLKGFRTWCSVSLWTVFDLEFASDDSASRLLLQYLEKWSKVDVRVRR